MHESVVSRLCGVLERNQYAGAYAFALGGLARSDKNKTERRLCCMEVAVVVWFGTLLEAWCSAKSSKDSLEI